MKAGSKPDRRNVLGSAKAYGETLLGIRTLRHFIPSNVSQRAMGRAGDVAPSGQAVGNRTETLQFHFFIPSNVSQRAMSRAEDVAPSGQAVGNRTETLQFHFFIPSNVSQRAMSKAGDVAPSGYAAGIETFFPVIDFNCKIRV